MPKQQLQTKQLRMGGKPFNATAAVLAVEAPADKISIVSPMATSGVPMPAIENVRAITGGARKNRRSGRILFARVRTRL